MYFKAANGINYYFAFALDKASSLFYFFQVPFSISSAFFKFSFENLNSLISEWTCFKLIDLPHQKLSKNQERLAHPLTYVPVLNNPLLEDEKNLGL